MIGQLIARFIWWLSDPLNWFRPVRGSPELTALARRIEQKQKLADYAGLTSSAVSEFLLGAIGRNIDAGDEAIKTLESKAASQIGFAGTIIAVFATLGRKEYLLAVTIPLVLSILCNIRAMFVEEYRLPSPVIYNLESIASDPNNKARIALMLTEAYGSYSSDLGVEAGRKSRYVLAGTFLLVAGIFALLWAAWPRQFGTSSESVTVTCNAPRCAILVTQPKAKIDGKRRTK